MVATAAKFDIRLVLTLTNYLPSYGGAQKYVQWIGGSSITDFYTRPDIRSGYFKKSTFLVYLGA